MCSWDVGLQITDASSFADYMPSDSASAPVLHDPTLPPPCQQPLDARASSRTPLLHPQQQPGSTGASQTPVGMFGQATLPEAGSSGRFACAVDGQGPRFSGQKVPIGTSQLPFSTQKGSADGQRLPIGASQFPISTQKGAASGQKRPASGQPPDRGVEASKHSRQTTLDSGLKGVSAAFGHMTGSAEGQPAGSSRQTPSSSELAPLHWSKSRQTPFGAGSGQHAKQHRAVASPYENVAQVLDLTQADNEPATTTEIDQHDGSPHVQPPARLSSGCDSKGRHKALLQPCSSNSPGQTANVVDLT